jgi:hypothetical protein
VFSLWRRALQSFRNGLPDPPQLHRLQTQIMYDSIDPFSYLTLTAGSHGLAELDQELPSQ